MDREGSTLAAQYHAVSVQQRRLANAETGLQLSRSLGAVRGADCGAIRQWRSWFADQIAALPADEQARERQVLALVDAMLDDAAMLRR